MYQIIPAVSISKGASAGSTVFIILKKYYDVLGTTTYYDVLGTY